MLAPYCEGATAEEPVVRLGHEAADWWAAQGVEVQHHGSLVVTLARDRRELDQFARRTTGHRLVTGADLAKLEPHVADRHDPRCGSKMRPISTRARRWRICARSSKTAARGSRKRTPHQAAPELAP